MVVKNKSYGDHIDLKLQKDLLSLLKPVLINNKKLFYLNDSMTWYQTPQQALAYIASHKDPVYASKMLDSEFDLIKRNVSKIISCLPEDFTYLDLGPGVGEKSKLLLEEALYQKKNPFYSAIDISRTMLDVAVSTLSSLNLDSKTFVGDFSKKDDLDLVLRHLPSNPKFIYLGSTLSNYPTESMLSFLSNFCEHQDLIYVSMQEKPKDIASVIKQYETAAYTSGLSEGLRQLGFSADKLSVRYNEETFDVENYLVLERVPELLKDTCLEIGDELVFFSSKKPSRDFFKENINKYFKNGSYFFENGFLVFCGKR